MGKFAEPKDKVFRSVPTTKRHKNMTFQTTTSKRRFQQTKKIRNMNGINFLLMRFKVRMQWKLSSRFQSKNNIWL